MIMQWKERELGRLRPSSFGYLVSRCEGGLEQREITRPFGCFYETLRPINTLAANRDGRSEGREIKSREHLSGRSVECV